MSVPRPWNLVAELTYRCPLRCPYCSNPEDFAGVRDGLDADAWGRIFREAAALGVVHAGLTGGEPTARRDLEEIVRGASDAGLYAHLVTAGLPLDEAGLVRLRDAGLRSVQLSVQDARPSESDAIAGTESFERKLAFAKSVRALALPLILNVVLHRANLSRVGEIVELARALDAERLELANVQMSGWALRNRAALLPTRDDLARAARDVEAARRAGPRPEILFVLPDWWADRPKPCLGGWGRTTLVVRPDGLVLPCHSAASLPGLTFFSAAEHALRACWEDAPGMNAFRGEAWMPEPCRSCPERARDFGGCRCQAFFLTGRADVTDPACALAPERGALLAARAEAERTRGDESARWVYRGSGASPVQIEETPWSPSRSS
jgi:pyrroloquinoline quinone biosynthesis protein E